MKKAASLVAAWFPFFALWIIFSLQAGITFGRAVPFGLYAIGSAAVLGLPVGRLCRRVPWPRELRPGFYAFQLLAASVWALVWGTGLGALQFAVEGKAPQRMPLVAWFLEGFWLYAIIAGVFYAMQAQRRVLQAETDLAVARLDALRSRLHPHFLFNALHTVGALVRHDPAEAEAAVEKLGDMLRYTLRDGQGDAVPFAEEWEFTRRYLDFEQLRYGDRLRVVAEIDPGSLVCSAPPFALQTLVENSVRHSISRRAEGGRVEISARAGGDRLQVRVRDDGGNGAAPEAGAGYGLMALRERLEAVGARLDVLQDDGRFEVSFSVPCKGVDDDD